MKIILKKYNRVMIHISDRIYDNTTDKSVIPNTQTQTHIHKYIKLPATI